MSEESQVRAPGWKDRQLERLREENEALRLSNRRWDDVDWARLRRIEEAARLHLLNCSHGESALRAALEEE